MIWFIALEHIGFLVLEMFLWTTGTGRKIFRTTESFAKESRSLAANQGLYNGFLAAGLIWSELAPPEYAPPLRTFFLTCVVIAGLFGGATVNPRVAVIQALPAALALFLYR